MRCFIWRRWCNGWTLTLLVGVAVALWGSASPTPRISLAGQRATTAAPPDRATLAGFTQAEQRLGNDAPTGAGVRLGHVEGEPGQYLPNVEHHRYRNVDLRPRSGESDPFNHTDATARIIYGPQGLAHGIREVHHFASPHWLGPGYLRAGSPQPPAEDRPHVFNHSWIGNDQAMNARQTAHVLRRIDYAIDRHGVVMCAGVNNGRNSRVPGLLASAYNVIAVGLADGASSSGGTRVETDGRIKPDLAGPGDRTSFSTPVVTAAVARLIEAASKLDADASLARRPEMIKALLMAGATKPWNWQQRDGQVLDNRLGAGVVHLDNTLRVLEAGRAKPDTPRPGSGWDLRVLQPGGRAIYRLDAEEPIEELSIVLTWHRRIDGRTVTNAATGQAGWLDAPAMARFDLRLVHVDDTGTRLLADSLSDIDNVQHIHLTDAPAGEYHLVVSRRNDGQPRPWPAAVAWRAGEHVPYPGDRE